MPILYYRFRVWCMRQASARKVKRLTSADRPALSVKEVFDAQAAFYAALERYAPFCPDEMSPQCLIANACAAVWRAGQVYEMNRSGATL